MRAHVRVCARACVLIYTIASGPVEGPFGKNRRRGGGDPCAGRLDGRSPCWDRAYTETSTVAAADLDRNVRQDRGEGRAWSGDAEVALCFRTALLPDQKGGACVDGVPLAVLLDRTGRPNPEVPLAASDDALEEDLRISDRTVRQTRVE